MKLFKGKKGFTLIELVVVIAILGILAGIAIPRFLDATATARGAKIVADMRTIDSAVVIYNAKTGKLPTADGYKTQLTTAPTATVTDQYQLLAKWPKPATGDAIFPVAPTKKSTAAADYGYDATNGRATITLTSSDGGLTGAKTADQLAEGGSQS